MKDRIKQVRKEYGLTQTAFGERIGVKGNTVTGWEAGTRSPSDAIINSICREFNILEDWLRSGTGTMHPTLSRDEEIASFMGDLFRGEDADYRKRLISVLCRLDVAEWELLAKVAEKLVEETKKEEQA